MTSNDTITFIISFFVFYISCVGFWFCIKKTNKRRILPIFPSTNIRPLNNNYTFGSNSSNLEQIVIDIYPEHVLVPPYALTINVQPPNNFNKKDS